MIGRLAVLLLAGMMPIALSAHSASDAYLTLTADGTKGGRRVVHGQWDIALRDLDFVLNLDDDGDGRLTWREVRRHQPAIVQYAAGHLKLGVVNGRACPLSKFKQMIDEHADGAYAAILFEASCAADAGPLSLDYSLFFSLDPSHRGIFVLHDAAGQISTAVLSPDHAHLELPLL